MRTKRPTEAERLRRERRRDYMRRWTKENREHLQDYRETHKDHRSKIEWLRLLRKYGITEEQYGAMRSRQAGVCAICQKPEAKRRLAIDHDHKTGRVRGLLCWWCNNKLLAARNTATMFRRAAEYLENDFDGRALEIGKLAAPDILVQPVLVEGDSQHTGLDHALYAITRRLKRDAVVHEHGLVFLTEDTWRQMHGEPTPSVGEGGGG